MPRKTHPTARARRRQSARGNDERDPRLNDAPLFCSCGKMAAYSEAEAWTVAMNIYHTRGGDMPQRVYSCNDDGRPPFHWTRQPRTVRSYA